MRMTGELFLLGKNSWRAAKKGSADLIWPAGRSLPTPGLKRVSNGYEDVEKKASPPNTRHLTHRRLAGDLSIFYRYFDDIVLRRSGILFQFL